MLIFYGDHEEVSFEISFEGALSDQHQIDFYDAVRALNGLHRVIAISTHFILNSEVITQTPSLRNAQIILQPFDEGSWKANVKVYAIAASLGSLAIAAGTASRDSLFGWAVWSAVDYVFSESIGVNVDYSKTLISSIEESQREQGISAKRRLSRGKLESVVEKCRIAVSDIHRPIAFSASARKARVTFSGSALDQSSEREFDYDTFLQLNKESKLPEEFRVTGKVSSYNINTFKGRVYVNEYNRTVPFELTDFNRDIAAVKAIVSSLSENAVRRNRAYVAIEFDAVKIISTTGHVKRMIITNVRNVQVQNLIS